MQQQQQGGLTKFISQQKKCFYQLTNQFVNNQFNLIVYYFLIIIQHFQIIGYQMHIIFDYHGWGVQYFCVFTYIINPQNLLRKQNTMNYLVPISFVIVILHIISIGYSFYKHRQKDKNDDIKQIKKSNLMVISHYYNVFICTILTIPIFISSILVFYCTQTSVYHKNRQCYATFHLFLIFMALINVIWIIIINIYYSLFYYTSNPFSQQNFLGLSSALWNILKFIVKVVPAGYLIFDQQLNFNILYVFGIAAGLLGYTAISRILYPYKRYNKMVQKWMLFIQIISISISLSFVLQAFFNEFDGIDITFIYFTFLAIPIARLVFELKMQQTQKTLVKINQFSKDNAEIIYNLIINIILDLDDKNKQSKNIKLFKIIKFHYDKCINPECLCSQYISEFKVNDNYHKNQHIIYKILLEIINQTMNNAKKSYELAILKSYIQFYKLKNTIKSAYVISKIMNEKINILIAYQIEGMLYQLNKSFQDNSNIQKYRLFSQHLLLFQKQTVLIAKYYSQFWHQIIEQNSSLIKLINLLKKIKISKKIIQQQFQILFKLYPTNIRIVQIYKQLYKQILLNLDNYMKYKNIYEQNIAQKQQSKLMRVQNQIKFSSNQQIIVFNISVKNSTDFHYGGFQVISVSNNVYKILGYYSQQLIGKNINRLLPKLYTQFHQNIISIYLNKNDNEIKNRQITIFPINSNGNVVQCVLYNKIMPSINFGINLVSFLFSSKHKNQNIIIYDQRTGLVDSMSEKAQNLLIGKRPKSKSIAMPDHISDILPHWDIQKQKLQQSKINSSSRLNISYSNIYIYRTDGFKQQKFVKILCFQLNFEEHVFNSHNPLFQQTSPFLMGMQTLVDNYSHKQIYQNLDLKNKFVRNNKNKKTDLQKKPTNNQLQKFEQLPRFYFRIYIIIQILLLLSYFIITIMNYYQTTNYYYNYEKDIQIKQDIEISSVLTLTESLTASRIIYNKNDQQLGIFDNIEQAKRQIQNLQLTCQDLYSYIIDKQLNGLINIKDLMLQVKYYQSFSIVTIKQQTITDAAYQFVLYLLEIYKDTDPINNLKNNIMFIFNNNIPIVEQFENLNLIFTAYIFKSTQIRKKSIITICISLICIIIVDMAWIILFKIIIIQKMNKVVKIYQTVPLSVLQKYSKKCQKFIQLICPTDLINNNNSIVLNKKDQNSNSIQIQKQKKQSLQKIQNQNDPLIGQQQQQQPFIKFSKSISIYNSLIQNTIFLLVSSGIFLTYLLLQNNIQSQNSSSLHVWSQVSQVRNQILKSVYFFNQYRNFGQQWNSQKISQISNHYKKSIQNVQLILQRTTYLDKYLSQIYSLIEQSSFFIKKYLDFRKIQYILMEEKLKKFTQNLYQNQIKLLVQNKFSSIIKSFLDIIGLILILQIIVFLIYAFIYIPNNYKSYVEKYQITLLMYKTLKNKLNKTSNQNIKKYIN